MSAVSAAGVTRPLSSAITFRGNLRSTRHGWLRLTPAYSVDLVRQLIGTRSHPDLPVLDPFCGTGTTLVACAESGVQCSSVDINPFLRWLADVKSRRYTKRDVELATRLVAEMARAARRRRARAWVPALHQIEKWWNEATLDQLSRAFALLREKRGKARDLAALSFCRVLVEAGNVSFRHQSMSFRERAQAADVGLLLETAMSGLAVGALAPFGGADVVALQGDSRALEQILPADSCGCAITSPPYVNRMSYIRELRPYMYWLGFLSDGRAAGELDWQAIGGTWGVATSKLSTWRPETPLPRGSLAPLVARIEAHSPVLGRYVERYFNDMDRHVASLRRVLVPGARAHYVIGNSKFFDVVVPAERLLASIFRRHGFASVQIRTLRRRTSKKELYEYLVSAERR